MAKIKIEGRERLRVMRVMINCPKSPPTSPMQKKIRPFCSGRVPNTKNDDVAAPVVKKIIVDDVATATSGSTPISSINGPLTIPPPIPKSPAKRPATAHIEGYMMVSRGPQCTSPLT
eukprot:CAMPEP_0170192084 /NCGR_PEP_ID=MMETSP0040_2-20121228/53262_1 /TAXON_ID=641309 /ORGANISM="Lotharella oceanica, Strain CCMP622" /LENGTH=116 /DNA_ID=CAMNT_0010440333 /DNA_START=240 /DNA_END=590 /DNA_ORIENTATION=+